MVSRLRGLTVLALGLALPRCLVSFPNYGVGDLDASTAAGGALGSGGIAGTNGATGGMRWDGGLGGVAASIGGTNGVGGTSAGGASAGGSGAVGGSPVGGAGGSGGSAGTGGTGGSSAGTGGASGSGGALGRAVLVINELDYDQAFTDSTEFIEIYNASATERASLDGVAVVFVNGALSPAPEYARVLLSGTLDPRAFAVVGSSLVTVDPGARRFLFAAQDNNIQNGSPDAVGLLDTQTNQLLDALSYEGSVTSAVVSGVPGMLNFVEGTPTPVSDPFDVPASLVRIPDGKDTNDANADWSLSFTPTPGKANQ
jgi:hypothetical protein